MTSICPHCTMNTRHNCRATSAWAGILMMIPIKSIKLSDLITTIFLNDHFSMQTDSHQVVLQGLVKVCSCYNNKNNIAYTNKSNIRNIECQLTAVECLVLALRHMIIHLNIWEISFASIIRPSKYVGSILELYLGVREEQMLSENFVGTMGLANHLEKQQAVGGLAIQLAKSSCPETAKTAIREKSITIQNERRSPTINYFT